MRNYSFSLLLDTKLFLPSTNYFYNLLCKMQYYEQYTIFEDFYKEVNGTLTNTIYIPNHMTEDIIYYLI